MQSKLRLWLINLKVFLLNRDFSLLLQNITKGSLELSSSFVSSSRAAQEENEVATESKTETKRPRRYKVLLHNDDYTTMEFVVHVLKKFFNKSYSEAEAIMLEIHNKGKGNCGIYTREIAEMKSNQVTGYAQEKNQPLKSTIEPE